MPCASLAHAATPIFSREHAVPLSTHATSRIATAGAPAGDGPTLAHGPEAGSLTPDPQPAHSSEHRARAKAAPGLLSDYMALFKVRVTAMVMITAWAGFYLGSVRSGIPSFHSGLLETLVGIGLVSAGASALNQVLERKSDARMVRTAGRPLAAGRISLPMAFSPAFAAVRSRVRSCCCATPIPSPCVLGLLTVFTYVAVYTPLKRLTTLATFIGAFPGAMGPLLGWTAARGRIEWPAVALFAILFVWQFPHFMAIAWLYREDYGRAGIRMLPVVQPDGWSTVVEALVYAVLMIPVSLLPWYFHIAGTRLRRRCPGARDRSIWPTPSASRRSSKRHPSPHRAPTPARCSKPAFCICRCY